MKANELRLGNLVYVGGQVVKVTAITADTIMTDAPVAGDYSNMKLKPILISRDWLERAGWLWNEESKSYEKYPNGDARMNLMYRELNNSYTMFNYVLRATIAQRIWFIHQLQNLYFALTGEELNISSIPVISPPPAEETQS